MATRSKSKKRHEQARQKNRPNRRADRRLRRKILLQLFWIAFGIGAMFYLLRNPREPRNWIGIAIWLALSLAWILHKGLRWLFTYLENRTASRR